ncbi:MAG: molybdenum cofactor guanylyltransferase [Flavobacterium sp.]|jgi:molybdenum cofactor guanylyltransferase
MSFSDKGLQALNNKPLIQYVINSLHPQVNEIIISHNRNTEDYLQFGFPVVRDSVADTATDGVTEFLGPLSGILSARSMISHPLCFIAPCDVPNISIDLVANMTRALKTHDAVCVSLDGRMQPLPLLIKTQHIDSIEEYLSKGSRSVKAWLKGFDLHVIELTGETLDNINDFAHLKRVAENNIEAPIKKPSN